MSRLNLLEETRYEKLPVTVFADKLTAAQSVARRIADLIKNQTAAGKKTILGLATGATPIAV
jgi:glucosamine-6-phosphate deaminase